MKKIAAALAGLCSLFFISCASNTFGSLCEFPLINSGDLASGRYIVMGEVTGENSLTMSNEEYNKFINGEAEIVTTSDTGDVYDSFSY